MAFLRRRNHQLYIEEVSVEDIVAKYGSPCYIYSKASLYQRWYLFNLLIQQGHWVCYSVKANSNLTILSLLAQWGSGFDIVSGGELARVIQAGGDPKKTIFSGVGKTIDEIKNALLSSIACFNVESRGELLRIREIAQELNCIAPIALRINPNIDAKTHPYITTGVKETKFGVNEKEALSLYRLAATSKHLKIQGISCHLGSQLTTLQPFLFALQRLLSLCEELAQEQIHLSTLNLGGGLGVSYNKETVPTPKEYCQCILKTFRKRKKPLKLIVEPGRALIAKAGILVTHIQYLKNNAGKNFAIVDAGMNDLLRPALYQAKQTIKVVVDHPELPPKTYDVVGPLCESSDFLAKNRSLAIQPGDYLAIIDSGAYGFSMSSNYNSRPRPPEILVDKDKITLIRSRETLEQLWANEFVPNSDKYSRT